MFNKVLVLRNCRSDMTAHNGFRWPTSGYVEAPDWSPVPKCGGGLHGWLWGQGDSELGYFDGNQEVVWLVVEVDAENVVDLGDKVKFPHGNVVFCGDLANATQYILDNGGEISSLNFATVVSCDSSQVVATGERGAVVSRVNEQRIEVDDSSDVIALSGCGLVGKSYIDAILGDGNQINLEDGCHIICGDDNNITGMDGMSVISCYCVEVKADDSLWLMARRKSNINGGNCSKIIAGSECEAKVGDCSHVIASDHSKLEAGKHSVLMGGDFTIFKGDTGTVFIYNGVFQSVVSVTPEGPIFPNTSYQCIDGEWTSV